MQLRESSVSLPLRGLFSWASGVGANDLDGVILFDICGGRAELKSWVEPTAWRTAGRLAPPNLQTPQPALPDGGVRSDGEPGHS